ncbi:hypothetical protein [Halococcus thailandensis]|jgi:hypothetical protein|uniref:Membrane-bound metal-dependent hydrolase n=1 Tax=Halococcus thailandensis JCM 13552 TaxID=1227457 RepID=M0MU46_9EURY|nr:hypothetical protein [Halococcus thailandensis]EMA48853.1 hypothetical protein C451_19873 [Halococcus thailandensis JCM 13552]
MSSGTHNGRLVAAVQSDNNEGFERIASTIGAVVAYAPFGWWLSTTYPSFALLGGVLAVVVGSGPDLLTRIGIPKRWTHSLGGSFAIGGLLAAGGWWFAGNIYIYAGHQLVTSLAAAEYGFVIGLVSAFGHILGSEMTGSEVQPLWPFINQEGSVNVRSLVDLRENEGVNFVGSLSVVAIGSSIATVMIFPL